MVKIEINGKVRRSFLFPADLETAFRYYGDVDRILDWLPHITKVRTYGEDRYRMLYNSVELNVYRVQMYCDLQALSDPEQHILLFQPIRHFTPVEPRADLHNLIAQGYYSSESVFRPEGRSTRIDYVLTLQSRLPVPFAARLVIPATMLDLIAKSITSRRITEIADGFIRKSVRAYQEQVVQTLQADVSEA